MLLSFGLLLTSSCLPQANFGLLLSPFVQPLDHFWAPCAAMEVALVCPGRYSSLLTKVDVRFRANGFQLRCLCTKNARFEVFPGVGKGRRRCQPPFTRGERQDDVCPYFPKGPMKGLRDVRVLRAAQIRSFFTSLDLSTATTVAGHFIAKGHALQPKPSKSGGVTQGNRVGIGMMNMEHLLLFDSVQLKMHSYSV